MLDPTQHSLLYAINELEAVATRPFVKSADVLALAMERAGLLTESRRLVLYTEVDLPADAVIAHYHAALTALVHEPDSAKYLVLGQGNFGSADGSEPAANPLLTECRLTELARASIAR
jgi:DNA gyrase/topoisomerase IV subunit A